MSSGRPPQSSSGGETSHQRPDMIAMNMILRMIMIMMLTIMIIFKMNSVTSMSCIVSAPHKCYLCVNTILMPVCKASLLHVKFRSLSGDAGCQNLRKVNHSIHIFPKHIGWVRIGIGLVLVMAL